MGSLAILMLQGLERIFRPFVALVSRRPILCIFTTLLFATSIAFVLIEGEKLLAPIPRLQDLTCTTGEIEREVSTRRSHYLIIRTADGSGKFAPVGHLRDQEGSHLYLCYADGRFFPAALHRAGYRIYYAVLEGPPSYDFEKHRAAMVRDQPKGKLRLGTWLALLLISGATLFWPWREPFQMPTPQREKDPPS
jgi:hypothetical protein